MPVSGTAQFSPAGRGGAAPEMETLETEESSEVPLEAEVHQQPRGGPGLQHKGASDGSSAPRLDDLSPDQSDVQVLQDIRAMLTTQRDEVVRHLDKCFRHQGQAVENLLMHRSPGFFAGKSVNMQGYGRTEGKKGSILRSSSAVGRSGVSGTAIPEEDSEASYEVALTQAELDECLGRVTLDRDSKGHKRASIDSEVDRGPKRASIDSEIDHILSAHSDMPGRRASAGGTTKSTTMFQDETESMTHSALVKGFATNDDKRGSMQSIGVAQARSIRTTVRRISDIDAQLRETAQLQDEPKQEATMEQAYSQSKKERYCLMFRRAVQALVRHTVFESFTFFIIFTNVAIVGIEVDYMAVSREEQAPRVFFTIDCVYTCAFLFELVCRIISEEPSFFYSRNYLWNYFDLMIVASSVLETVFTILATSGGVNMSHFRVIRVIRVTRLVRTFRMVRLVRFIRALRTLLYSIMVTMKSLVWALLLLLMIFYGFGVAFTQAVSEYNLGSTYPVAGDRSCGDKDIFQKNMCELVVFWGTLPRSMFTLFKAIAGGVSWHEVVEPLGIIGWVWVGVFVGFIAFTFLAVLNVVTGVFCQSAIESAQQDKDIATMQLMAAKGMYVETVKRLFDDMDADASGAISIHEFESYLQHEKFQAYFASLDIDASDVWSLFKLMDSDRTGTIDLEEFVGGCLQLRGQAKAVQIAKMSYDQNLVRKMLVEFMDSVDERLDQLLELGGVEFVDEIEQADEVEGGAAPDAGIGTGPDRITTSSTVNSTGRSMGSKISTVNSTSSQRRSKPKRDMDKEPSVRRVLSAMSHKSEALWSEFGPRDSQRSHKFSPRTIIGYGETDQGGQFLVRQVSPKASHE